MEGREKRPEAAFIQAARFRMQLGLFLRTSDNRSDWCSTKGFEFQGNGSQLHPGSHSGASEGSTSTSCFHDPVSARPRLVRPSGLQGVRIDQFPISETPTPDLASTHEEG
jgi:hypothetical protein